MVTRISRLCLWFVFALVAACGVETPDSTIDIVGGQVSNDVQSPVVTFTLAGGSVAGSSFSRSCTATRIGDREFLTAASCLDRFYSANAKLALMLAGNGKMLSKLEVEGIRFHPKYDAVAGENSFYNVASFSLKATTPDLETSVGTAVLEQAAKPQLGSTIRIFGGGCESVKDDGSCASASSWTKKIIKVLETKVTENSEVTGSQSEGLFFSDKNAGFIVGDDVGGPVFQPVGQKIWRLVGINAFPRLLFQKVPAYIWVGHVDIFDFVKNPASENSGTDMALAAEIASTIKQIDDELAKCSENQTPVVAMTLPRRSSSFSAPLARTVASSPCPKDPAAREARIRALYLAKSFALAAQEALKQGNAEEAKALLERSKEMLNYALMITEFIVDFTPLGRVKDGAECLTGYKAFPELEEGAEGETTKVFKMKKLERIDQVFSCVGALGLDERLLKYVGGYLTKFEVFRKAVGYVEDFIGKLLTPADTLLKKLDTKYQRLKSAVFREKLSDALARVKKGLGQNATQADVEEFMDVAGRLNLESPDQLEGLASFLGNPNEVKKLKTSIEGLSAEEAQLVGFAKGRMPDLSVDEVLDLAKTLDISDICRVTSRSAALTFPQKILDFVLPTAYAITLSDCAQTEFKKFITAYLSNRKWELADFKHVMFGDFILKGDKWVLDGGMHTSYALQRLIALNQKQGKILKIKDFSGDLPFENTSVDEIYRQVLSNGTVRILLPQSYINQYLAKGVDPNDGSKIWYGIKTLFPDSFEAADVGKLADQVPLGSKLASDYVETTLNGIKIRVKLVMNKQGTVRSFYPDWLQ
jgi:hypothetical protein